MTERPSLPATPLPPPERNGGERGVKSDRKIRSRGIVKEYHTPIGVRRVLDGIDFEIGLGEKIAILGRNGAGKSPLVKLIAAVEPPTSGTIERGLFMSWPLAFGGGFSMMMSGYDNIRFIARIYGIDPDEAVEKVDDFAELGRQLYLPVRTFSSGQRSRLAFGLTLAVDFECYLIDEVISVGDQRFQRKCHYELFEKRADKSMILVSHDVGILRSYCAKALILKAGRGRVFEDLELAISIYETL